MLAILFTLLIGSSSAEAQAQPLRWDLNDVSVLFPLPGPSEASEAVLLAPQNAGAKGELLPWSEFQIVPTLLNNGHGNATVYRESLRVVALRIDPCPAGADECLPEMRLVWQPIERDAEGNSSGNWTSRDGAVHAFYSLSQDDLAGLRSALMKLKTRAIAEGVELERVPLGVHPALRNAQTAKWFSPALKSLVLKYCGQTNLRKMTFMSLLVPSTWWRFGSLERNAEGRLQLATIPRLTTTFEDIFNSAREKTTVDIPGFEMDAVFNVLPTDYPSADNLMPLINQGYRNDDASDLPVFQSRLQAVDRFQNPHMTNPSTLDCASCHYANAARYFAGLRFPVLQSYVSGDAYANPDPSWFNLENKTVSTEATRVIRAFGYFKDQPAIMQRVIHDSAETAHWFNTH